MQYNLTDYQVSHHFKQIYTHPTLFKKWNKWHYNSMFHSVFQSFSFIVHNYSHWLVNTLTVQRSARLKLNFPTLSNMLLSVNGRLVHNGNGSKYEHNHSYNKSNKWGAFWFKKRPEQASIVLEVHLHLCIQVICQKGKLTAEHLSCVILIVYNATI